MRIIDITAPIRPGMPVWPGDPEVERSLRCAIADGAGANVSVVTLGAHTGTHLDAPYHFLPEGITVERLSVEAMVGSAQLVEIEGEGHVTAERLERAGVHAETRRLLLKTENSRRGLMRSDRFHEDFAAITADAAEWIVRRGIRLVGVDYLSVEPFRSGGHPTHTTLLSARIIPLEGCDLTDAVPGDYTLVCAPMKLAGADGAPTRAYLLQS